MISTILGIAEDVIGLAKGAIGRLDDPPPRAHEYLATAASAIAALRRDLAGAQDAEDQAELDAAVPPLDEAAQMPLRVVTEAHEAEILDGLRAMSAEQLRKVVSAIAEIERGDVPLVASTAEERAVIRSMRSLPDIERRRLAQQLSLRTDVAARRIMDALNDEGGDDA